MRKLSKPMETMISGAEFHEIRVNGEIVKSGYMIAGSINTVVALIDRDVCTSNGVQHYGINWLTESGMVEWARITGKTPVTASEDHPTQSDMITDVEAPEFLTTEWSQALIASGDDVQINAREAAIEADNARLAAEWDDVAAGEEHYESLNPETNELPYDAERIFDMENAALEGADIRTEYEAEVADEPTQCYCSNDSESCPNCNGHEHVAEGSSTVADYMNAELDTVMNVVRALRHADLVDALISEIMADDRLMYLTPKGIFVSGEYVNTMRRLSEDSRDSIMAWRSHQYESRLMMVDDFHVLDMMVDEGTMTFGRADRYKRHIRNTCRPHIGAKRKPSSSKRRNRR